MNKSKLVSVGLALSAALTVGAAVETRSDIDPAKFPASWDVSKRTTYQVDVTSTSFTSLETMPFSVVAMLFDLDSGLPGLSIIYR